MSTVVSVVIMMRCFGRYIPVLCIKNLWMESWSVIFLMCIIRNVRRKIVCNSMSNSVAKHRHINVIGNRREMLCVLCVVRRSVLQIKNKAYNCLHF